MRRIVAAAGAAALAFSLAACSGSGGTSGTDKKDGGETTESTATDTDSAKQVDVATWWSGDVEGKALDALLEVFKKDGDGYEFVNVGTAGGGGENAKQKIQADLASKNPPDTYQLHAGAEAAGDIEAGYLEPVDDLVDKFGLSTAFPETLISALKVDGKIYSLPFNVHRANVVWANPAVLEEAGVDKAPAKDLDAWLADMKKVKDAGKLPLALGTGWTQVQLFETVLIADLGADGYKGLFDGSTAWDSDGVKKAVKHFTELLSYTNEDKGNMPWEEAAAKVLKGDAAYHVMGDWAYTSFTLDGKKYNEDYVAYPVPGTEGIFDFLADSFTKPVGAKHPEGADEWLKVGTSIEGQVAFNKIKGSIPARSDIPADQLAEFSEYQQDAMKSFANDTIVPSIAHGAALSIVNSTALTEIITNYTAGASDEATFVSALADFGNSLK